MIAVKSFFPFKHLWDEIKFKTSSPAAANVAIVAEGQIVAMPQDIKVAGNYNYYHEMELFKYQLPSAQ